MRYLSGSLIFVFVLLAIRCKGFVYRNVSAGMAPTLKIDDRITVDPYAYSNRPVERFDIVVCDASRSNTRVPSNTYWIKRVIGLPGETVEMHDGGVFIDGQLLEEPFQKIEDETDAKKNFGPITVPENEYFLLGDNRPNSEDSRFFRPPTITKDMIRGKLLKVYPKHQ